MRRLEIFRIGQGKVVPELLKLPTSKRLGGPPKRSIQNLLKESFVSYVTMSTVLRTILLTCLQSSMPRNTNLLLFQTTPKMPDYSFEHSRSHAAKPCWWEEMRRNSMLNTTLTPKMIEFGRGMEMKDPVWWLGSNVRSQWCSGQPYNRVRKKALFFVDQGVKLNLHKQSKLQVIFTPSKHKLTNHRSVWSITTLCAEATYGSEIAKQKLQLVHVEYPCI